MDRDSSHDANRSTGLVRIEMLGISFSVESDEDASYVRSLAAHVEKRISEVESTAQTSDPLKKAILAALLIADDYFRHARQLSSASPTEPTAPTAESITAELIAQLNAALSEA